MRCPICKKPVDASSELSPFCSERCKVIDLGNWATGKYVVSSPLTDIEDLDFEAEPPPARRKDEESA